MLAFCTAAQPAANATEFVKADKHYRLSLEDYWTVKPPPPAPLDVAFACDERVCGKRVCDGNICNGYVQFVIGTLQAPVTGNMSQGDFFRQVAASDVAAMAQDIARSGTQSFKELSTPRKQHFGRNDYYVTDYDLLYKTGASRNLMMAVTFNRGFFYYVQFFAPQGTLTSHKPRFEQVLSSMQFLEQ